MCTKRVRQDLIDVFDLMRRNVPTDPYVEAGIISQEEHDELRRLLDLPFLLDLETAIFQKNQTAYIDIIESYKDAKLLARLLKG